MTAGVERHADLVEVRLESFPVALHAATEQHLGELVREFAHIAHAGAHSSARVPARLLALVGDLRDRYAPFAAAARGQLATARLQGRSSVDLVYQVPPSVAAAAEELNGLLDEADEFCRQGHLLTLASTDEMIAFRHWLLEELRRQVEGARPRPWAAPEPSGPAPGSSSGPTAT